MVRVLVHALGATAGGGLGYLRHLLTFARSYPANQWVLLVPEAFETGVPLPEHVRLLRFPGLKGRGSRLFFDQYRLRSLIRREQVDVMLATGNFGLLRPPVPQILLNRNALYFSREHRERLWERGELAESANILLRQKLALASIRHSQVNVVPSRAMELAIREWLPADANPRFEVIPHGFDPNTFHAACENFPRVRQVLASRRPRVLLVSHYNYFRNFETLIRALAILRDELHTRATLLLTTRLAPGLRDHRYDTTQAAELIGRLALWDQVEMLGTVPRDSIRSLYDAADIVACPSYVESFGHPLVEAMACGKPIVASGIPIHREVCGEGALYFPTYDPRALALRLHQLVHNPALAQRLVARGGEQWKRFSWDDHFHRLLGVLEPLAERGMAGKGMAA
ncbi:MAG: glycosyltransferase family 1 protein [Planctomycetota bacterium]